MLEINYKDEIKSNNREIERKEMQEIAYWIVEVMIFWSASKPFACPCFLFFYSLKCTFTGALWEYVWMKGDEILPKMQQDISSLKAK